MVGVENNICAENCIEFIDNYGVFRVPSHFVLYKKCENFPDTVMAYIVF